MASEPQLQEGDGLRFEVLRATVRRQLADGLYEVLPTHPEGHGFDLACAHLWRRCGADENAMASALHAASAWAGPIDQPPADRTDAGWWLYKLLRDTSPNGGQQ